MRAPLRIFRSLFFALAGFTIISLLCLRAVAQESAPAINKTTIDQLDKELNESKSASSEARQRISLNRIIRNAEELVAAHSNDTSRFLALEFLFRARQRLISLDKDPEIRKALLETCNELVKAPDDMALLRLDADLLLTQVEQAKQGADAETRAKALRPLVQRYIETPAARKVIRMAIQMALELGDNQLITDMKEMTEQRFADDLEMIAFLRDKLGGHTINAPFAGNFETSDGKIVRYPMEGLGRLTMLLFWSKDDGMEFLKGLATSYLKKENETLRNGRLEIVSINVDDLPDAGESILRGLGVPWRALRLPGGRKNPHYNAYARVDPRLVTMSPTGNCALLMSGSNREKTTEAGKIDFDRTFSSALARSWTNPEYMMQIRSILSGDFLVFDPEGPLDPTLPPELKASAEGGKVTPLSPAATDVPVEVLRAIQASFVAPPMRYRQSHVEARASYGKVVELCRKAIADYPGAGNLWIVRNRLIVALMGLWKNEADIGKFEEAVAESKKIMEAAPPAGCDLIARFCLAREALRVPESKTGEVIARFLMDNGGDKANGTVLSMAALLSIDGADRPGFERYRTAILKNHTEHPMMWVFNAFLLDRYQNYWFYQVPFESGRSFGYRVDYFLGRGISEEANRMVHAELKDAEGKSLRIPEDLDSPWTVIVFSQPPPWSTKPNDGLPPHPNLWVKSFVGLTASRANKDTKVVLALLGGDAESARAAEVALADPNAPKPLNGTAQRPEYRVVTVPGGISDPLVHRVGILMENVEPNAVLLDKSGRITLFKSGMIDIHRNGIFHCITLEDEKSVIAALKQGDLEGAKKLIFTHAPPFDPNAVDAQGRPLRPPSYQTPHLRARAQVYMATKEWDKALADIQEVVERQLNTDGVMSLRTPELDACEALRDEIKEKMK
jgi:hypothetical protein